MNRTKYIKESELHKVIPAGSKVTFFPNPRIIEADGIRCHIIRENDFISVELLTEAERDWYIRREGHYVALRASDGHFPTDLVAGIKGKKYSEDTELSQKTGWVNSYHIGSGVNCFEFEKYLAALDILREAGYVINLYAK